MPDTELYQFLSEYVSDHKKQLFEKVLAKRTRYITTVIEDVYQPHNASAVMRSCDGMGIQDVHIIENYNDFEVSEGVSIGADKWLTQHFHHPSEGTASRTCFERLKDQGYVLCATTPHRDDVAIENLPLDKPLALIFGAELEGLSQYALDHADCFVRIPMYGFSESFNISVSAAICMYELRRRLEQSQVSWQLTEAEKQELRFKWTRASINRVEALERYFYAKRGE